jgi:hypothetical protein
VSSRSSGCGWQPRAQKSSRRQAARSHLVAGEPGAPADAGPRRLTWTAMSLLWAPVSHGSQLPALLDEAHQQQAPSTLGLGVGG